MTPPEGYSLPIDAIRAKEYPNLENQTYLDHAGTTLYAKSLIQDISSELINNTFGNPHSDHNPSKLSSCLVENARLKTLRFFNADSDHFDLIFVANASAAIKLVGDCFRDASTSTKSTHWYGYHQDCHTSLVGLRESTAGHHYCFASDKEVEQWIEKNDALPRASPVRRRRSQLGLFAYPGQSNFHGRRLPLDWSGRIRRSVHHTNTYTLLDAAALATTGPLDLSDSDNAPDFTCVSFYKIFGFPDLGGLIVRNESGDILRRRRNFYGGTVDMVISAPNSEWHAKKSTLHDRMEDGTLPFHSIIALGYAIDNHLRIFDSMEAVSAHAANLTRELYEGLSGLKHANGRSVCIIYRDDTAVYGDPRTQGATIAFNVQHADGSVVGYADFERLADRENISVRSGSLCNPGGFAKHLKWSAADMKAAFQAGHRCSRPTQIVDGKLTGVVRASLGAMTNLKDVQTLIRFVRDKYVDEKCDSAGQTEATGLFESTALPKGAATILAETHSEPRKSTVRSLRTRWSAYHLLDLVDMSNWKRQKSRNVSSNTVTAFTTVISRDGPSDPNFTTAR